MERVIDAHNVVKTRQKEGMYSLSGSFPYTTASPCMTPIQKNKHSAQDQLMHVMFYKPDDDDYFINRAVAFSTREEIYNENGKMQYAQFAHVELSFPFVLVDGNRVRLEGDKEMAFSITQNEPLFFRPKTYRDQYVKTTVVVNCLTINEIYKECQRLADLQIKFDKFGMYGSSNAPKILLQNRTREIHGTFCSKIITEVLQLFNVGGSVVNSICSYRATPNTIFTALYLA